MSYHRTASKADYSSNWGNESRSRGRNYQVETVAILRDFQNFFNHFHEVLPRCQTYLMYILVHIQRSCIRGNVDNGRRYINGREWTVVGWSRTHWRWSGFCEVSTELWNRGLYSTLCNGVLRMVGLSFLLLQMVVRYHLWYLAVLMFPCDSWALLPH